MANNNNNNSFRAILQNNLLTGINFLDWERNLKLVLRMENKLQVIETPVPPMPAQGAPAAEFRNRERIITASTEVACLMLASMVPDLQKQHEDMYANEMIVHLRQLFTRQEHFETSKKMYYCKQGANEPVGPHVLKMINYIERLEKIGFPLTEEIKTDLVLQSLDKWFSPFVSNFLMNGIEKPLPELLSLLQTHEDNNERPKPAPILMVEDDKPKSTPKGKRKRKGSNSKPKAQKAKKVKGDNQKNDECFRCGKKGHWRRNCEIHIAEQKAKRGGATSASGICYKISIIYFLSIGYLWVLNII